MSLGASAAKCDCAPDRNASIERERMGWAVKKRATCVQGAGRLRFGPRVLTAALGLLWIGGGATGAADTPGELSVTGESEEVAPDAGAAPEAVPDVGLDSLLKLPSSWQGKEEKRQGLTAADWRGRFAELNRERESVQRGIDEARRELDSMAGEGGSGPWQMGAPGSNNTEVTPMSFKHRELIRDGKEQLEAIRRKERALNIEADMAGVPAGWRVTKGGSAP